jgi:hypothetical protein
MKTLRKPQFSGKAAQNPAHSQEAHDIDPDLLR